MRIKLIVCAMALVLSSACEGADSQELPITAHLHRIVARYEVGKSTLAKVQWSAELFFDNALTEGKPNKMSEIIQFFSREELLPDMIRKFRVKLFAASAARQFSSSYVLDAFTRK